MLLDIFAMVLALTILFAAVCVRGNFVVFLALDFPLQQILIKLSTYVFYLQHQVTHGSNHVTEEI